MTLTYAGSVQILQSYMDACVMIVLIGCITCVLVAAIQAHGRTRELRRREKELDRREKELDKWQL